MLQEFRAQDAAAWLIQADGQRLPFRDGTFGLVLLMQVLSGAHDWQSLLCKVGRVLAPTGTVVVGRANASSTGVDAQLKRQLAIVLEQSALEVRIDGISRVKKRCHGWKHVPPVGATRGQRLGWQSEARENSLSVTARGRGLPYCQLGCKRKR